MESPKNRFPQNIVQVFVTSPQKGFGLQLKRFNQTGNKITTRSNAEGIDLYVIEGPSITDIVSQYNLLSGGGPDVPEWGLGVLYRCHTGFCDHQILKIADYHINVWEHAFTHPTSPIYDALIPLKKSCYFKNSNGVISIPEI